MGIHVNHTVTVAAQIDLDEQQIRALDALAGYGTNEFLKIFYEKMGRAYLEPHESGLRALFENVKQVCRPAIREIDRVRSELTGNK